MIRSGDTIHNPVTGERITFLATSRETNGEAVVIETVVQPHGFVAAAHVHPSQSRPALQFESLLETMFALAADGKTNSRGMPNPLRLAVIAKHHFDTVRLPFPPAWMQKVGLVLGAPLGRLVGYRPTCEPDGGVPALAAG